MFLVILGVAVFRLLLFMFRGVSFSVLGDF